LHGTRAAAIATHAGFAGLAIFALEHAAAFELVLFKQIGRGVAQQVAFGFGQGVACLKAASS
jgi:hypothetical protein